MKPSSGHRVIMTSEAADRYGADVLLRRVAENLRDGGADVEIVLPTAGPGLEALHSAGLAARIDTRAAVIRRSDMTAIGMLRFAARAPIALLAHLRAIRQHRADLVWVNTVIVPMWIIAGWLLRRRVVVHDHEIVGGPKLIRRIAYAPLLLADAVIVISEACRADIASVYPRLAARTILLTNRSFEITDLVPLDDPDSGDIVMMGRINERKGQHVLLAALELMAFPDPPPTVHICGDAYPPGSPAAEAYRARIAAAADRAPIPVRMHGYIERERALRLGSIVVVPSAIDEPWSLVVSEALTAGRAVVGSASGGIVEQLTGYGVLVPPNDPPALAAALQDLVDHPARRRELMARAGEWHHDHPLATYFPAIQEIAFGGYR